MSASRKLAALAASALCAAAVSAAPQKPIVWHNALEAPFELTGFPWRSADGTLRRLPETLDVKKLESPDVGATHMWQTAGGEIRFMTSSDRIMIRAELYKTNDMHHMTRTGAAGIAVYTDPGTNAERLQRTIGLTPGEARKAASSDGVGKLNYQVRLNNGGRPRLVSIYLPLYSGVKKFEVGLDEGAKLLPPPKRKYDPICFYGSSITQGCSASHPGNAYTTLLCRAVGAPQINVGFSDGARGEQCVAEAIAGLKLSAFVMDYDHNAKSLKQLRDTHEKFFKTVRAAQPKLPIIIVSGPRDGSVADFRTRRDICRATYQNAVKAGDKHVYFVDGLHFYDQKEIPVLRKFTTVDNTHPTDLGFHLMYRKILPVLKRALAQAEK